jgi:hypothetical protein
MNQIKFSHDYFKLNYLIENKVNVRLLHVFVINSSEIQKDFLNYDTIFWDKEKQEKGYYPLPKGQVLVLLFYGGWENLFTTIRRFTPEKLKYYNSKIGEEFKLVQVLE